MKKIPVDLKNDLPPMLHEPEHQRWLRFNERSQARPRVKHAQILRYGLWWLERERQTVMENAWFEKMLLLGKPAVPAVRVAFSQSPEVKKVCLIPTFHVRKDNALFVFERGPKWSLEMNAIYPD